MCTQQKTSVDSSPGSDAEVTSIATAREVLGRLISAGIKNLLLSPGSRSAPLAYAAAEAEAVGLLNLHVRIDERSAGFMALGMAQATGEPVGIVVTSGTAVGELLPAVMEADHSGTSLLVLSADRPNELQGTGASQTTEQRSLFASHTRASLNIPAASNPHQAVDQALAALAGNEHHAPGPAQLNLQFRDPLVPENHSQINMQDWTTQIVPGLWKSPRTVQQTLWSVEPTMLRRTVVIAGHDAGVQAQQFAQRLGLPLLAEPSSNARHSAQALSHYRVLLAVAAAEIERVVLFGRPTLSRPVAQLLAAEHIRSAIWQPVPVPWYEAGRRRERIITEADQLVDFAGRAPAGWLNAWQTLDTQAQGIVREIMAQTEGFCGYQLAQALWEHRRGPLFIGSSNIIRDFDLAAQPDPLPGPRIYANRGLAGIDGSIATALGIARGSGEPTRVVLGDITFLHDASSMLLAPGESIPTMDVVVFNDAGGAIFSTLEHGAIHDSGAYNQSVERLFATPHQARIDSLAEAYGWQYVAPQTMTELRTLLAAEQPSGVRIIEVRASRDQRRAQTLAIAQQVAQLVWPESTSN